MPVPSGIIYGNLTKWLSSSRKSYYIWDMWIFKWGNLCFNDHFSKWTRVSRQMRKCTIYKVSFSAISNLYLLNIGINDSKNTQVLATTAHAYQLHYIQQW